MTPIDPADGRELENLILRYAELVDDGDFTAVAELLADATYRGSGAPLQGRAEIEQWFRDTLIVYPDGTPRTQHVTTNIAIEADGNDTAEARSYVTVLQAVDGAVPQVIAAGRYRDRFERRAGGWRWTERTVKIRLVGDVSKHLRS
ncbi:nuclear transport factor 2 family protein [Kribbella sp.]|uniref:nuclear transport factor 2 family protein n=1 Tax=Kribbella sp. TaxID=1871183 RepID=UPI002D489A06|nr:nuclear transport factor 2 family protein [Kribbella sp.]HZX05601.1 nuclear transport factor 2 family protein [Kribbella sp.]